MRSFHRTPIAHDETDSHGPDARAGQQAEGEMMRFSRGHAGSRPPDESKPCIYRVVILGNHKLENENGATEFREDFCSRADSDHAADICPGDCAGRTTTEEKEEE